MRIFSIAHPRTFIVPIVMLSMYLLAGCASMSSLQSAAARNDTATINNMLAQGSYVDTTDGGGWTALHWAADYGKTEAAIVLIQAGANLDARDNNNWTSLHWAAVHNHAETAIALIKAGADISLKDNSGNTFIQTARNKGYTHFIQIVERETQNITAAARREQEEALRMQREQREAEQRRLEAEDNRAFEAAGNTGSVEAWSAYLKTAPSGSHRTDALKNLAALLVKAGDPALTANMAKDYPGLIDHLPLKLSLALIGPPGLTVAEVVEIKGQGLEDRLIAAQIRSTGAAYKKFSLKEIMELKKMGLSADVIEAMIDSTTKAHEKQAEAEKFRKLEDDNMRQQAELERMREDRDRLRSNQQAQPTPAAAPQPENPSIAENVANCVAQAAAIEVCNEAPGGFLGQAICKAAAKASFPCN